MHQWTTWLTQPNCSFNRFEIFLLPKSTKLMCLLCQRGGSQTKLHWGPLVWSSWSSLSASRSPEAYRAWSYNRIVQGPVATNYHCSSGSPGFKLSYLFGNWEGYYWPDSQPQSKPITRPSSKLVIHKVIQINLAGNERPHYDIIEQDQSSLLVPGVGWTFEVLSALHNVPGAYVHISAIMSRLEVNISHSALKCHYVCKSYGNGEILTRYIHMIQDKSQGWGQEETNTNNRIHILNMCNCLNNRWWRIHFHILKLWYKPMIWACGQLDLRGAQRNS